VHGLLRSRFWGSLALAPLVLLLAGPVAAGPAAPVEDDREVVTRFAATGAVTSHRLQQDLARASWPQPQLRAALTRAYGLSTTQVSRYLASPAGAALLQQQLRWWSPALAPQPRLAALRAAIIADSRDGSVSLLGVLQRLPVPFVLAEDGPGAQAPALAPAPACGCPQACGSSALAHLAFLMACLQAGATGGSGR
jgi:hypothetical protein